MYKCITTNQEHINCNQGPHENCIDEKLENIVTMFKENQYLIERAIRCGHYYGCSKEELEEVGTLALYDAISNFDSAKFNSFSSYAYRVIHYQMLMCARKKLCGQVTEVEKPKYYYEFGIFPSDDIEDAYSLFFELDFSLNTNDLYTTCAYMVEKGFLSESDALDCNYIKTCTKDDYKWSKK